MHTSFDTEDTALELGSAARAVRSQYQRGLLGWFRDVDPAAGLAAVGAALSRLVEVAGGGAAHDLFQAAQAVSEALRDGQLPGGTDERRLFRLLDGEIKRLGDAGGGVSPDPDLLHEFLHCAGRLSLGDAAGTSPAPAPDLADDELGRVFVEEAQRELDSIVEGLEVWGVGGNGCETLAVLQRALLSLRGAGRLVGAGGVATVADAAERLLSGLEDAAARPTPAVRDLVDEAVGLLARLIDGQDCAAQVIDYVERVAGAASAEPDTEATEREADSFDLDDEDLFEDDEDLLGIFLNEADELLEGLDRDLAAWSAAPDEASPGQAFAQTLHTLKRGAGLSDIREMHALCEATETLLDDLADGKRVADGGFMGLLRQAVARLGEQAADLRARGEAEVPDDLIEAMRAGVDGRGPASERLPAFLAEAGSADRPGHAPSRTVPSGAASEIDGLRHDLAECKLALDADLVALDGLVNQLRRQLRAIPALGGGDIPAALLDEVERLRETMGERSREMRRLMLRESQLVDELLS